VGWAVIKGQALYPTYFDPPAYPWLEPGLTMASVAGQWMLARKYGDNWPLWIIIDLISTGFYASMGMIFTALMYSVFTLIAVKALIDWKKQYDRYRLSDSNQPVDYVEVPSVDD
jgi:nicotinamide mononucleotide transporter